MQQPGPPPSSGRAAQRGGAQARPGDVGGLAGDMAAMSIQQRGPGASAGGGLGPRGRRRGDVIVQEPRTRPDHCKDKKGESNSNFAISCPLLWNRFAYLKATWL